MLSKVFVFVLVLTVVGICPVFGSYVSASTGSGVGYDFWDSGENSDWAPTYQWFTPQNGQGWRGNDTSWTTSLPFNVRFCGVDYAAGSSFYVGSNGVLGFASANMDEPINQNLPNGATPNAIIALLWDDLVGGAASDISLDVSGTAPARQWIITYSSWYYYGSPTDTLDFQVVISETDVDDINNTIEFRYRDVVGDSWRDNGASATVGLENSGGTQAAQYSLNQGNISNGLSVRFTDTTFIDSQLGGFYLLTPEDHFHGRIGDNISMSWEAASYSGDGVVTYKIYLAENRHLTDALILDAGTDTSFVYVFGTGDEAAYYWLVKATESTLGLEQWANWPAHPRIMTIHSRDWAIAETSWGGIKALYSE